MRRQRKHTTGTPGLFRTLTSVMLAAAIPFATMPEAALALPRGGHVTKGSATLSYSTNTLLISQKTSSASFSWTGFNVGSNQSVTYKTPGAASVSMNFIGGTSPATISGKVVSNGILTFMDANGLVFESGSTVSASGVRAWGSSTPGGSPTGAVTNAGTITVSPGGTVALVGSSVANSGTISAPSGEVILAAGSTVTLSSTGSSSLSVVTSGGGSVTDSGIISAENIDGSPGTIVLKAGMSSGTTTLTSTAVLDASAPNGGNGGSITVDAYALTLDNVSPLDVSAPYGKSGTVTIDPNTINTDSAVCLETIDGNGNAANQTSYLGDTINLTGSIDLATGSTLYNWIPLGASSTSAFTGTFNGNGHTVCGYTIAATSNNGTGFIGYLGSTGKIENLGVTGTVDGGTHCIIGGLVGENNGGTITNSYTTGAVSGNNDVGGLVGYNNGGTITNSYTTGAVSGNFDVGGLVGFNSGGKIEYSYTTGEVLGSGLVGGLGGYNDGTIEYSYATGAVSGSGLLGGLVGYNSSGTYTADYWNTNATISSGNSYGVGNATSSVTGVTGLSVTGFGSSGNFSGWTPTNSAGFNTWSGGTFASSSTDSPWFMGSVTTGGATIAAPILVGDLPSDTIVVNNGSKTYDGTASDPSGATQTVSFGGSPIPSSDITYSGDPNAGTRTVTPGVASSYSPTTQSSPGSFTFIPGTLTIGKATLTLSGTEVYNGTTTLAGSRLTATGVDGQTFSVSGTGADDLSTANVQTNQPLANVTNLSMGTSANGGQAANYNGLSAAGSSVSVTPATLTATANIASMTYGSSLPALSGTVTGFVNGQTLASDSGTASWTTSATSTSNAGRYGITGSVSMTLGSPYFVDYTIVQSPGNSSALTITATSTSPSGGETSTNLFPPPIDVLPGAGVPLPFSGPSTSQGAPSPTPGSSSGSVFGSGGSADVMESSPTSSLSVSGGTGSTQGANSSSLSNSSENNIVGVDDTPK